MSIKNNLSKKHLSIIIAILIVGVLAAFSILYKTPAPSNGGDEHGHSSHGEHAEAGEHKETEKHDEVKSATKAEDHQHDEHDKQDEKGEHSEHKDEKQDKDKQAAEREHADEVKLNNAQIKAAAIQIATAGPAEIKTTLQLPGEIRLNEDRTAHIVPRIGGVVESVSANLGQAVKRGQVLAVIASPIASEQRSELQTAQKRLALAKITYEREKMLWEQKVSAQQDYLQAKQTLNEAEVTFANAQQKLAAFGLAPSTRGDMNRFELRAPFDGLIIEKHLSLGEAVKEDAAVFTLSDLRKVWAEVSVSAKDLPLIRVGELVTLRATAFDASAQGTVAFVGALIGEQTRTAKARVVLDNPNGAWRPGLFVNVEVTAGRVAAPVTVANDAIQTVENKPAVFVKVANGFIAQPVQLGKQDGQRVEIVQGLKPGTPYAANGSFVIKSELGKASAEHSH